MTPNKHPRTKKAKHNEERRRGVLLCLLFFLLLFFLVPALGHWSVLAHLGVAFFFCSLGSCCWLCPSFVLFLTVRTNMHVLRLSARRRGLERPTKRDRRRGAWPPLLSTGSLPPRSARGRPTPQPPLCEFGRREGGGRAHNRLIVVEVSSR